MQALPPESLQSRAERAVSLVMLGLISSNGFFTCFIYYNSDLSRCMKPTVQRPWRQWLLPHALSDLPAGSGPIPSRLPFLSYWWASVHFRKCIFYNRKVTLSRWAFLSAGCEWAECNWFEKWMKQLMPWFFSTFWNLFGKILIPGFTSWSCCVKKINPCLGQMTWRWRELCSWMRIRSEQLGAPEMWSRKGELQVHSPDP